MRQLNLGRGKACFSDAANGRSRPRNTALLRQLTRWGPAVLYEVGGAYDTDGREAVAAEYYRKAMDAGLEGKWLRQCYLQYGSTLRNLGLFDESLSLFDEGIRLFPDSESLVLFRSLTLHAAGKPSTALGSVLQLVADRFQTDEVLRYEAALRGNAAYLESLDSDTPGVS